MTLGTVLEIVVLGGCIGIAVEVIGNAVQNRRQLREDEAAIAEWRRFHDARRREAEAEAERVTEREAAIRRRCVAATARRLRKP